MTTETYGYNKNSTVQTILISAGFIAYFTYNLIAGSQSVSDPYLWIMAALDLGVFSYIIYLYTVRLRPAMQHETALELTPDALVFKPKNITIPWNTISNIDTKAANRSGTQQYLDITLNDPPEMKNVRIDLDCVAGDPADIYAAVVIYLDETRKAVEKPSSTNL